MALNSNYRLTDTGGTGKKTTKKKTPQLEFTKEYQKLPSKPSSSGKKSSSTVDKLTGAFVSNDKIGKKYSPNESNFGQGEQTKTENGEHKASGEKTKDKTKITELTGDDTTKTATKGGSKKGIGTSFSQGGISGQKVVPEKTSGTGSGSSTGSGSGSGSGSGTKTQTESKIEIPLKEVEQATRREAEKVQSYDPYADDQYNRQLEEFRQSIAGAYERQREESDLAYDRNKSAADRAALARGMGRSSYNLQTMANIDTEKAKARQTISDKEEEAAQQFGVQLASELRNNYQWETAQNYQRDRDTWSDYYQQQGLNQNQQSLNMQAQQNAIANQQADRAYNYQVGRDQTADQQWQQSFNYQQSRDQKSDEQWEKSFGYQQQRDTVSDEQWTKTFEQNQKLADQSQANTEKQYAAGLIQYMAQNGGTPSDALLKAAGISRKDYNAMKKKTSKSKSSGSSGGSGSGGSGSGGGAGGTGGSEGPSWWQLLFGYGS